MFEMLKKIFDPNEWEIKKLRKHVEKVNELEPEIEKLSDEQLKAKTPYFQNLLKEGKTLDDILPEAFAVVREVSRRTLGLRHYDVQMIGGLVLHQGRVAEMKTGEGKTLVGTLPVYLNALTGKGVHVVTVNDYLAKRDARWMSPIYHFLGLSTGVIQHEAAYIYDPDHIVGDESLDMLKSVSRREAYHADITYGTNNEFGFDYLRDNMVMDLEDRVQRELIFAIVDEVDSILIDEARTPLIISGRGQESSDDYKKFARIAGRLENEKHYTIYEKEHNVALTDEGYRRIAEYLGLPKKREGSEYALSPQFVFPDVSTAVSDNGRSAFIELYNKANAGLLGNDTRNAVNTYLKALETEPDNPEALNNLAVAYTTLYNFTDAEKALRKAAEKLSDSPELWFNLGCLKMADGKAEQAIDDFRKAYEKKPSFSAAYNNEAVAWAKIGEFNTALELLEKGEEALAEEAVKNDLTTTDKSPIHRNYETMKNLMDEGSAEVHGKFPGYEVDEKDEADIEYYISNAMRAKEVYKKDVDYVVKDDQIIIVDEFTGRLMFGRRYSDGLHQAIEAKENVKVRSEDQTLASITFQNYFRMYEKLAGMTGTAATEEKEFRAIYNVDVVIIPTNKPMARQDLPDRIYKSEEIKFRAVITEVEEMNKEGRPVLVGTRSIEKSEVLAAMLKRKGIKHNVLNAKHHEKEAQIIAEAGRAGAVTIATNMAGRGVDIILGGTPPSAEIEHRKYQSAKNHLDLIRTQLDEMKSQLSGEEEKLEESRKLQLENQTRIGELTKQARNTQTDAQLEEESKKAREYDLAYREQSEKVRELKKRIQTNVEMLPSLEKNYETSGKEYREREKQVAELLKEHAKEQEKVRNVGGLHIIGTERHESRRIDNQLRGRAGRQGDNGSTRFYVALDDELMRLFGSDRLPEWLKDWSEDENVPLEHGLFTRSIHKAQEKVESHHFDVRKSVLDYDNVMNEQRKVIYGQRDRILRGENIKPIIEDFIETYVEKLISIYTPDGLPFEEWDLESLYKACREAFIPMPKKAAMSDIEMTDRKKVREVVLDWANYAYNYREEKLGETVMRALERWILLQIVDQKWMDHLATLDQLREGIGLRAYGQKDPLIEYINESHEYFQAMNQSIQNETVKFLFRAQVRGEEVEEPHHKKKVTVTREHRGEDAGQTTVRKGQKVGRNDACPCGSGKKFKKCCGR
ncbi:MAG: preprotein translocase subunit SecA [Firmicutes bacterium]|nr:preprotein translocase subunit SecA [Bacillota bacterium]